MKTKHLFLLATLALTLFSCEPPYEEFFVDFSYNVSKQTVKFQGEHSYGVESYTWDFGDGTVVNDVNGKTQVHKYNKTGAYKVVLVVVWKDERNLTQSKRCEKIIEITEEEEKNIYIYGFEIGETAQNMHDMYYRFELSETETQGNTSEINIVTNYTDSIVKLGETYTMMFNEPYVIKVKTDYYIDLALRVYCAYDTITQGTKVLDEVIPGVVLREIEEEIESCYVIEKDNNTKVAILWTTKKQ